MKCEIDARGLACPQPVVLAKNKMKDCTEIEILVDNETAVENIKRLASSSGWTYDNIAENDFFKITLKGVNPSSSDRINDITTSCSCESTTIVFSSDKMGRGDDELGAILMKAFIHTLLTPDVMPSRLVFYNSGVLLTAEGSGVTDDLQILKDKGIEILICGTCVNFYNIGDKIKTGTISNMYDILSTMNNSSRLINP
jgi:selenium metabolism protein YedF